MSTTLAMELYGLHTIEDVQAEIRREKLRLGTLVIEDNRKASRAYIERLWERHRQLSRAYNGG